MNLEDILKAPKTCPGDQEEKECDTGRNPCGRRKPNNICWYGKDGSDYSEYGFITDCGGKCPKGYREIREVGGFLDSFNNCYNQEFDSCLPFSERKACIRDWNMDEDYLSRCCVGINKERDCHPDYVGEKCTLDSPSEKCRELMGRICAPESGLPKDISLCQRWCSERDPDDPACSTFYRRYCSGNRLSEDECKIFCSQNPLLCEANLKEFCKDKFGDKKYKDICGCYYPQEIYDNFYHDINSRFNIDGKPLPEGILFNNKKCFFPDCSAATIIPQGDTCPALNITECINKVDIDNRGNIIGKIDIKGDIKCGGISRVADCRKNPDVCKGDEICIQGECKKKCTTDADCSLLGEGNTCNKALGYCSFTSDGNKTDLGELLSSDIAKKFVIGVGILILFIFIVKLLKRRKK